MVPGHRSRPCQRRPRPLFRSHRSSTATRAINPAKAMSSRLGPCPPPGHRPLTRVPEPAQTYADAVGGTIEAGFDGPSCTAPTALFLSQRQQLPGPIRRLGPRFPPPHPRSGQRHGRSSRRTPHRVPPLTRGRHRHGFPEPGDRRPYARTTAPATRFQRLESEIVHRSAPTEPQRPTIRGVPLLPRPQRPPPGADDQRTRRRPRHPTLDTDALAAKAVRRRRCRPPPHPGRAPHPPPRTPHPPRPGVLWRRDPLTHRTPPRDSLRPTPAPPPSRLAHPPTPGRSLLAPPRPSHRDDATTAP